MLPIHHKVKVKAVVLNQDLSRLLRTLEKDNTSVAGHVNSEVTDQLDKVLHTVLSFWKAAQDAYPDSGVINLADFVKVFYEPKEEK